jgi:hypothetical protein
MRPPGGRNWQLIYPNTQAVEKNHKQIPRAQSIINTVFNTFSGTIPPSVVLTLVLFSTKVNTEISML